MPVTRRSTAPKPRRAATPVAAAVDGAADVAATSRPAVPRVVLPRAAHRFRIGQRLRVVGGGANWARQGGYCKVVALMPHEGGAFAYRIRSEAENFERVVAETDLSLPDLP